MKLRSLLFVPGDSERKFDKAQASGADALILDLEDSVAPAQKAAARAPCRGFSTTWTARDWSFFVRINALDTGLTLDDLAAVVKPGLDGVLVPKANGVRGHRAHFGHYLDALRDEGRHAARLRQDRGRRHRDGKGDVRAFTPTRLRIRGSPR